ncbi:MAG TPA: NAD-glutamate dehydrogenase domain-containing protein, partial [Gammaproteobacteria bacterium]|nr:NAD-glutamate dehydrogenase domain-containing protein [Gammaproteobacteria bacterium]
MAHLLQKTLKTQLKKKFGLPKGEDLFLKYHHAFSTSYNEECPIDRAIKDILRLEKLSSKRCFAIDLYKIKSQKKSLLHLRLYQYENPIPLSDILPILENLGLRTLNERPYEIKLKNKIFWISDFLVEPIVENKFNIQKIKPIFSEAFKKICTGRAENDELNKLVFNALLNSREIMILRAYSEYLKQAGFRFSQQYIKHTVAEHPSISKKLIRLFQLRFDWNHGPKKPHAKFEQKILDALDDIKSLSEDRIMRKFYQLIKATVRTNYFQLENGKHPETLAFKFQSQDIPDLPLPYPLFEIFVYSPKFCGIHLRSSKVSRGGIRWSDRHEDLRTEIFSLMKAQRVKNSVIVPSGAKGGFVLKDKNKLPDLHLVIHCYQLFIRALLNLTDNIIKNVPIHPKDVLCYDDYDPYLVVAADKGTGSFSDIANSIAKEYRFWLGDAFASGGITGYNHKEMGITARGAWESIRRHFREININMYKDYFTVVGIGDMGGDVFGNGMLYSPHIRLIAAFNGNEIFIDPDPDPKKSYQERLRLFQNKDSTWKDYNPKLISPGGGVFSRGNKSLTLTTAMKTALGTDKTTFTPDELICVILKAPVTLLYNGGIGTYVKASYEKNDEVLDKENDFCRVNGDELRCLVVGEGGNLGFTQLGRIEFAMNGGLINTDFIDNSAGADCSDHEVNIKILLDKLESLKKITPKARNALLGKMKDEVAELVLKDNYNQALTLSLSTSRSANNTGLYQSFMQDLEAIGEMDRAVEYLPDDKTIVERKAAKLGLTAPEIAVLLAYSKIHIKNEILKSKLPEDPFFIKMLEEEFPKTLQKKYHNFMKKHRLHREIISTQLANKIVNEMGVTFVYRIQSELGATASEVIRAYAISSNIFQSEHIEHLIETLSFKVPAKMQYDLLHHIRNLINLSTRWFLRANHVDRKISEVIQHFAEPIKKLEPLVPELVSGNTKIYLQNLTQEFMQ